MWLTWVLAIIITLMLAAATAAVADSKGQSGALWFFIGLIAPVLGLLIALVALEPAGRGAKPMPTPAEAARESPVARLLASSPGLSAHAITEHTQSSERAAMEHLAALRSLGLADRDDCGRWRLTDEGTEALVH
jgi:DNA-binding transcriptional ArsR family regulator